MIIGEDSYFNKTSMLYEKEGKTIYIGDRVSIGHWCYISTCMHKTDNPRERFCGDIHIMDDVWIGNNVVIYPNVTIGVHSVIGHGCTITRDIPDKTIVKVVQYEDSTTLRTR